MSGLILTEEELKKLEWLNQNSFQLEYNAIEDLINSHRLLFSANAELSYQTMLRVKYEGFLRSVIRCKGSLEDEEDFEWFKQRHAEITKSLEDAKCKTQ